MRFKEIIHNKILKSSKGYTLVEMLLYVVLLGIIVIVIAGVFLTISRTNSRAMSLIEINSNAYSAMDRMAYEIANAENVYLPTSNFTNFNYDAARANQFSLKSEQDPALNENIGFLDFYMENNTIFLKQDGAAPIALTSKNVRVESFNLYYYKNDERESVKIDLIVSPNSSANSSARINLSTVVALRS